MEGTGFSSKSEFIRQALRDALSPSGRLSLDILEALEENREQREKGETKSSDEVRDLLGLND